MRIISNWYALSFCAVLAAAGLDAGCSKPATSGHALADRGDAGGASGRPRFAEQYLAQDRATELAVRAVALDAGLAGEDHLLDVLAGQGLDAEARAIASARVVTQVSDQEQKVLDAFSRRLDRESESPAWREADELHQALRLEHRRRMYADPRLAGILAQLEEMNPGAWEEPAGALLQEIRHGQERLLESVGPLGMEALRHAAARKKSPPSKHFVSYAELRKHYDQLADEYALRAYGDPRMGDVISMLERVPANDYNLFRARSLLQDIAAGRARLAPRRRAPIVPKL